jgi:hypothetical protein
MSWVVTAVIIAIVVLLFTGGASMIAALFKDFTDVIAEAAGTANTILGTIDNQLKTCKKNGFFAFWKGCVIGVGAIGYLGAMLIGVIFNAYVSFRKEFPGQVKGSPGAEAFDEAARLGANVRELTQDLFDARDAAFEELRGKGYKQAKYRDLYRAAIRAASADRANKRAREEASEITDEQERKAAEDKIAANEKAVDDQFKADTEKMSDRDTRAADDARAAAK